MQLYNLIMQGSAWEPDRDSFMQSRMFEYTDDSIILNFRNGAKFDFDGMKKLPCLFMREGVDDQIVSIGRITSFRTDIHDIYFEYTVENDLPVLTNSDIHRRKSDFGFHSDFEFSRTHWAIKDVDLYRAILKASKNTGRSKPKVFRIPDRETVDPSLLSVMMPFDPGLRSVFEDIKTMAGVVGMQCKRGDDIWVNDAIIQDIVDLIDKSKIVICDLTGRNANVFYETGIAHTLGRNIILITQNNDDVPFDLRHLRYIKYLNNAEGRAELCDALRQRIGTLVLQD